MLKAAVISLGCKVNDYEATFIKEELKKEYEIVDNNDYADIYVIFTCCVTNTAESKTRKAINRIKKINNNSFVCAVGCYPQTKPETPIFNDVDLVLGTSHKNEIPKLIREKFLGKLIEDNRKLSFESMFINNYPNKSRAFLKIQDGCNQFCSYCVIPYARGNERSESHEKILKIAENLSQNYKEIVLTGIHTGKYNDNGYNLFNLLTDLIKINNIETIRLSSIEINELSDDLINLIASNNKIAPHLHIPFQSLNDEILSNMHRPYKIEQFKERIKYIRNKIKDISISTDLIVGFPGETIEIFNTYFKELDEIKFSFIHVFPYSKKDGTLASTYDNQIENGEKKKRVNKILEYQASISFDYINNFIGTYQDVLIEENNGKYSFGYSRNYMYIKILGIFDIGKIVTVYITEVKDNIIIGEYVSK